MSINIEIGQFVFFYNFEISGIETQAGVTYTSGLVDNLSENDNPVLVIGQLKD